MCPYRLPGVIPTTGTIIQLAEFSPFRRSNKNKSSLAKLPPPVAPPYMTSCKESTTDDAWAALGDGLVPNGSTFKKLLLSKSNEYVSPVIEYFPVSPVAPPNRIALVFDICVIVCPG